ncbi:MAG: MBL fold metallo-hydrolase [Candidatus Bathyarchaeia archaeon]|jgi:ribonuclease BN (tRNA processing enzyme)
MQQLPNRQFIFHNAGQGLFYSGKINDFEFVYDCGSFRKQHLNDIVLDYKNTLPNGKLDLLILSHLHEDHVAGLYTLFHNNPKTSVERVILPYLSPAERLVLAVGAPTLYTGDWYYNFLSDPVRFFLERGVKRITYLGGSERDRQIENSENPDVRDNEQSDRFTDKLKPAIALRKVIIDNEPHLNRFLTRELQIKSHDGSIIISANSIYWQFQ